MSGSNEERDQIPNCAERGHGRMVLKRAGADADNPGRWYYKCLVRPKHTRSFLWCDEYHEFQPDHLKPRYVVEYLRMVQSRTEASSSHNPSATTGIYRAPPSPAIRSEVHAVAIWLFMAFAMFSFGVIIGKLM